MILYTSSLAQVWIHPKPSVSGSTSVAEVVDGNLVLPSDDPERFLFRPEHIQKHRVTSVTEFLAMTKYKRVHAWHVTDATEYPLPKEASGCVVWIKL